MPNRLIRDGILSSARVDSLSFAAEVFYRRLMSLADDYGRYTAEPVLLRSACFPRRVDDINLEQIAEWLKECASRKGLRPVDKPLVIVYEAAGKTCLEMQDFGQRIRSASKYPDPPTTPAKTDTPTAPVVALPKPQPKPRPEQEPYIKDTPDASAYSERMYAAHPRKKNKPLVEMECVRISKKHGIARLADISDIHARWCDSAEWRRDGGKFVPGLDRWLSDEGYTADLPGAAKGQTWGVVAPLADGGA